MWARILDVPAALSARTYATEIDLVLDVHDPFLDRGGRFRLHGGPDRAECVPVAGAADRTIATAMVPRTEVEFLDADMTVGDAARDVLRRSHSRYPVIASDVDDVVGVVHVRDLLTALLTDPRS